MAEISQPTSDSPFHEGEVTIQRTVGMAERMEAFGKKVIRDFMPQQHRDFFAQLPFIIAATVDDMGDVWPTILCGEPGFIQSPSPTSLTINAMPYPGDPAANGARSGGAIGMLGIELDTRRRNRINGTIADDSDESLGFTVGHSFGNCPQYIQLRDFAFARDPMIPPTSSAINSDSLDDKAKGLIERADTFFVASYVDREGERQVDASHRGGKPGFVRIEPDGTLTIPDFAGNFHFNTLGNFLINPRAGLIFIDFETGDILQMAGRAEVILDSPEIRAFQGAERLWTFAPTQIVLRRGASPLRWKMRDDAYSPNSLMTGSWLEAAKKIEAEKLAKQWRTMRIANIVEETPEIRSFFLEPADGKGMADYFSGQHLPVRAAISNEAKPTNRVYTISSAPSDGFVRISVKSQGAFSNWLHNRRVGDILQARAPAGTFYSEGTEDRPAVLIAAGIGITPMLSMLRQAVFEGKRRRGMRPTWVIHAAQSRQQRPFHDEIGELITESDGAAKFVAVHSSPAPDEHEGADFSWAGRFQPQDLSRLLPFGDYDFYLCGPSGFMQSTYDGLRAMGVGDQRIHAETFGPSSLKRSSDQGAGPSLPPASSESVPVLFANSAKEARWQPETGTLLELAEQRGLAPDFSCRTGSCGTCAAKLLKGAITYPGGIAAPTQDDEILLCSAIPAQGSATIEIAI